MEFKLNEEQVQIQRLARDFAQSELAPKAAHHDETGEFPWENIKKMREVGFLGMMLPETYGGAEMDYLCHTLVVEEVSRACASTGVILEVHNSLHSEPILTFGTEAQKERWLPGLVEDRLGAFALTEPEAGSDAGAVQTTAILDGDEYILNGRKCFITSGSQAHQYIVIALTDKERGSRGLSAFVVDKDNPGMSFGKPEEKLGIHASCTTDVILEDCRVPVEDRLGNEGDGFKIALATLDGGRIGIAAQSVGIAQAAYEAAVAYAKDRVQFGKPIARLQAIQWMIAEMKTKLEAARLLTYRAAYVKDHGPGRGTSEIAMAKLFASEAAGWITDKALQVHGGYGYMHEYPVERHFRDVRITQIYEGTSEVMKLVIAGTELR